MLNILDGAAGAERRAIPLREGRLAVLRVDGVGDQTCFGPGEISGVDAIASDLRDNARDRVIERFERRIGRRNRVGPETRRVERGAEVVGAGRDGDFLFDHKLAIQQARLTAAQQMGEQFKRFCFAGGSGSV